MADMGLNVVQLEGHLPFSFSIMGVIGTNNQKEGSIGAEMVAPSDEAGEWTQNFSMQTIGSILLNSHHIEAAN